MPIELRVFSKIRLASGLAGGVLARRVLASGVLASGVLASALLGALPHAARADVLQPYAFQGTLGQSVSGSSSVSGQFVWDATTLSVPSFQFTAPTVTFDSTILSLASVLPITGTNPAGNFVQIEFFATSGQLTLNFEITPTTLVFEPGSIDTASGPAAASSFACQSAQCFADFIFAPIGFASGSVTPIPEPMPFALLGGGLALLGAIRARRSLNSAR